MGNIFEELSSKNGITKAKKIAKKSQTLSSGAKKIESNFIQHSGVSRAGGLKTFYLKETQIDKITTWKAKGYSASKIIQYLIDNAPETF